MSETKILHCPFCGGKSEIHSVCSWHDTGGDEMFFVMCGKCLTRTRYFSTKKSAILTWNTRNPMEKIVERLKEVSFPDIDKEYVDDGQEMLFLYDAIEIIKKEDRLDD